MKLSLCLATYNEEKNLGQCLESVKDIVDEIIVVDGSSTDRTLEIAKKYGAKVISTSNKKNFHINKQMALDKANGEWILQLDADERVSPQLSREIKKVIEMGSEELEKYQKNLRNRELFLRHQAIIENLRVEDRKSKIELEDRSLQIDNPASSFNNQNPLSTINPQSSNFTAFYLPRLNYFLGKPLRYGGVYPDGVIRLVKKGKARFPCKSIHELMAVDGKTGWLQNNLLHYDSPTFKRYIERNNRYISMMADELTIKMTNKKLKMLHVTCYTLHEGFRWLFIKPIFWFIMTTFRHKGILDGWRGIVFSFFSALRFPRAFIRYLILSRHVHFIGNTAVDGNQS